MGTKLRAVRKAARKAFSKGLARGIFKKLAGKLRVPKNLPRKGARVVRQVGRKAVIATKSNYRKLFVDTHPRMPKTHKVHHSLPQRYEDLMRRAGINIHENKYLRGVNQQVHDKITTEWGRWHRSLGRRPTAADVQAFAKVIDAKYGNFFTF